AFFGTANLSIWSTKNWTPVRTITPSKDFQNRATFSCSVSPNGKYLAAVGSGLRVWDFEALVNGSEVNRAPDQPFIQETNGSSCAAFDPSGLRLGYMHFARFDPHISWLFVRDLKTKQPPMLLATNLHVNYVQGHCFLPKSGAVAYVTRDRTVAVIDPADGRL